VSRRRQVREPSLALVDGDLTAQLARRVTATRLADLPPDVVAIAKQCILDCLGVALRGAAEPVAELVCAVLGCGDAGDGTTVIGRRERLSRLDAAVVNGTSCHALDFDDTQPDLEGHPSAPVLAALLPVAESRVASGASFLAAFVAGVECECLLGAMLNPEHYERGWHATATLGRFGAAAACSNLISLPVDVVRHSLGLAATQVAGLKSSFGTMAKPFQVGKAAGDGALAALLAEQGVTSNPSIVETRFGLECYGGARRPVAELLEQEPYRIRRVLFKLHAACHLLHPMLDALGEALERRRPEDDEIEHVELHLTDAVRDGCPIDAPATGLEAKFSARGSAALLLSGHPTYDPDSFRDDVLRSKEFRAAFSRVHVVPVPGDTWRAEVRITATNGRTTSAAADLEPPASLLDARATAVRRKFEALVEPVLGPAQTPELYACVQQLESLDGVDELAALCVPQAENRGEHG
jgi:2-methylcitrate dehydratase PrpD